MSLTIEEVEHIADLARLSLTADEKDRYLQQLSAVLDYFKDLQEVDTSQISPTFSVTSQSERSLLRKDKTQPSLPREVLQQNAPDFENGQFRVPPILDYDG